MAFGIDPAFFTVFAAFATTFFEAAFFAFFATAFLAGFLTAAFFAAFLAGFSI